MVAAEGSSILPKRFVKKQDKQKGISSDSIETLHEQKGAIAISLCTEGCGSLRPFSAGGACKHQGVLLFINVCKAEAETALSHLISISFGGWLSYLRLRNVAFCGICGMATPVVPARQSVYVLASC